MSEFLSTISLVAAIIYLCLGLYTYRINKYSTLCRAFLLLTTSMAIWSFAYSFAYTAENVIEFYLWNKFSAFGWCTFPAFTLYFILILTEHKLLKYWFFKVLVMLPAPIFLYMTLFQFGAGIKTHPLIENLFYTGNFIYNFSYLLFSILLLFFWGKKTSNDNQKKQAKIIVITSLTAFILNLVVESFLPMFGLTSIPRMGQIDTLIMLWGVYYAIVKYQFLLIPTSIINKELFNEIAGLTILVDTNGIILKVNKQVFELLDYSEKEMTNVSISTIINIPSLADIYQNYKHIQTTTKHEEIYISTKSGDYIPFNLSITPLFDPKTNNFLGLLIIGVDIRTTQKLQSEITQHKATNQKLKTSEVLFRTMVESVPFAIILTSRTDNSVLYLNNKSEDLFQTSKLELIGLQATSLYKNPQDRYNLINDINENKLVKERELIFKKRDGSNLTGLITIVPAVYLEQEVILACIIDITEQRKLQREAAQSEKMLTDLMNSITDMVTVIDLNGNLTFTNQSACTVFNLDSDFKKTPTNIYDLFDEEDSTREKSNRAKIVQNTSLPFEYTHTTKDGTNLNIEAIGTTLYDDDNDPFGIVYVSRNITQRKQEQEQLKRSSIEIEKINNELLEMNLMLKNRSLRDSLTNLYNHQCINDFLEDELIKISKTPDRLCAMMIDIDLFKHVNDTYGHQVGDKVLIVVSELISKNARTTDLVGRYGGEEFIVILPGIDLEAAYHVGERIRQNIQNYAFDIATLKVTVSIGLAEYQDEDGKSLINRSDTLLYQAKRNGRNRIETEVSDT